MDLSISLNEFLEKISSSAPTPGGGSVSSFSGVLGLSLAEMVCNLTIGKKKYESVESEVQEILQKIKTYKEKFLELYDKDSQAFDKVMNAFKLPKETEEEKSRRNLEIEKATVEATEVPIQVIESAEEVLESLIRLSEIGNQNSLSDAGVALILLKSCAEGAFLNVLINTKSLNDRDRAMSLIIRSAQKYTEIEKRTSEALNTIKKKLEL